MSEDSVVVRIGKEPQYYNGAPYRNTTVVNYRGRNYPISHKAILTLVTVAGCNAACKFCSNEITFTPGGRYLEYDEKLERVKELALLAGVRKVAFSGGEPTVHPEKLLALVSAVVPGFERARLHTNGFGLLRPVRTASGQPDLIDALLDAGMTGISISVAHHDPLTNAEVMQFFKGTWKGMDTGALKEVAARVNALSGASARLSCVMTPEGVHDLDAVRAYTEWAQGLGFKNVIFRSPSGIPEQFTKRTLFTDYNADHHFDIHTITDALVDDHGWAQRFAEHKSDSHVHVYRTPQGMTVDVDDSSEEVDPDDKIRRLTVMPNRVLYKSWIDPLAIVFDDDLDVAQRDAVRQLPFYPAAQLVRS